MRGGISGPKKNCFLKEFKVAWGEVWMLGSLYVLCSWHRRNVYSMSSRSHVRKNIQSNAWNCSFQKMSTALTNVKQKG